jgi:hypothetical protein
MKKIQTILIFTLLTTLASAQEIKKVYTKDLVPIAKEFGIDSALHVSRNFSIYKIDSIVALNLLDYVSDVIFPSRSSYYFNQMSHHWLIEPIKQKTAEFAIRRLHVMMSDTVNSKRTISGIDNRLLIGLIKQKPDSIDQQIMECYLHCNELANGYKKIFPSAITRVISFFKDGNHPAVLAYKCCHRNCYALMWTLGRLQSKYFNAEKLNYHNLEMEKWFQNEDIFRYEEEYSESGTQILILNKQYNSIDEIDFASEPNIRRLLSDFDNNECRKYMLINEKNGFIELVCRNVFMDGHGATYKLELIDNDKLKITMISRWIS